MSANPASRSNISTLTQTAWWEDKAACRDLMWGSQAIAEYIATTPIETTSSEVVESGQSYQEKLPGVWQLWSEFWGSITGKAKTNYQQTVGTGSNPQPTIGQDGSIISVIGIWAIGIIGFLIVLKICRRAFEILYDMINARRIIYLRVMVPRGDTKSDREREKELAKDMKEKIWRMSQVFRGLHKLGELSLLDTIMEKLFDKPKISMMLHYIDGSLTFIVWVYPEYQSIVEGAISAQYSESTIEITEKPKFFDRKYEDVIVMEPVKDPVFPIRTYKQLEDDPLNNVIDTIGKISNEDIFTIQISIKPVGDSFNHKALKWSEWLYRNDSKYTNPRHWYYWLNPLNIIKAFKKSDPNAQNTEWGKDMVRMTKAKEEALNIMGEEAGKNAFQASLLLAWASDDQDRLKENMRNVASTFVVYKDEYNNELDHNQILGDMFEWFLEPFWIIAMKFHLIGFFFQKNIFSENALTSLFHFPDGLFNRAPIIKWMDYKVLSAPDNLAELKEDSGFVVTGSIMESFRDGKIPALFADSNHRAVGSKTEDIIEVVTYDPIKHKDIPIDQIITAEDGSKTVNMTTSVTKTGLKIFKDGSLVWVNVYRNKFTPVYIKRKDRSRHHYIIGKSGWGKSVLLDFLARQDAWNGDGFCMIDPHGDLVESVLNYIPASRAKDVIYFNAGDEERPMGLNLYHINDINEADRVVNDATQMFLKLFGPEVFGPRLQEYFKFGSLTLLEDFDDPATILDIPRLFTDEAYREYKVAKVTNAIVRNFWEKTYASIGDREKEEIIPYLTAKFVDFSTNRIMRNIIGQTQSVINFRQCMDEGKILLVNLSKGKIGDRNTSLLGMIIVAQIANGAMSRADIPEEQRRDFFLYVDEFQNFVTEAFADILSEARKYHLALIMAHQYIAQLDGWAKENIGDSGKTWVKDAVFGNVGTMQSFKVGAPDAEFLEKEYAPVLSAQDIIGISNFKTYLKLNINNATSRVFSIDSLWSQDYKNPKVGEILKEYSAKKYGRKREFVEAEISARLGILPDDVDPSLDGTSVLEWVEDGEAGWGFGWDSIDQSTDDSVIARSEDTSDEAIQWEEVIDDTNVTGEWIDASSDDMTATDESQVDSEEATDDTITDSEENIDTEYVTDDTISEDNSPFIPDRVLDKEEPEEVYESDETNSLDDTQIQWEEIIEDLTEAEAEPENLNTPTEKSLPEQASQDQVVTNDQTAITDDAAQIENNKTDS
jgi:hypothetical protein